jgi:hypothetical protein
MNIFSDKYGPWAIVSGAAMGLGAELSQKAKRTDPIKEFVRL